MARITILFVIDSLGAGGAERQLVYLLEGLDRQVFAPVVLTVHDAASVPPHFLPAVAALDVPVHSLEMPLPVGRGRYLATAIGRYVRLVRRLRPQIVQGCLYVANIIAMLGRPLCPAHTLYTIEQQSFYSAGRLRWLRWLHPLSDRLITNSPHTSRCLTEAGRLPAAKLLLIPCGVKLAQFARNPQPGLREQLFPAAGFVLANITRIDPEKDHPTLLRALGQLHAAGRLPPDFRLLIMGAVTDENAQAHIDHLIAAAGLGAYVRQLAPVQEVAPYYHLADATVLPSIVESFGLVVIEAMCAGKPVIASEGANVLAAVRPGVTGWTFPTQDVDALAAVLAEVLATPPAVRAALGQQARQTAAGYSVEQMVAACTALYLG
ncbi:MAG: glycosyltransferase [Anaerolineae bacterium]|jgi:glycosyltransferase involved in cell wall biosynthesis|nr:glycosyltransferase [Anaerolineae bacterium]